MLVSILKMLPLIMFYGLIILLVYLFLKDKYQNQHSVLKTHPVLGRIRYLLEMIGPEFRQYWFLNDKEAKPVDRDTQETIAKAGKYANTVTDRKSTRLNSSHVSISYAVFCLKKKKIMSIILES